MAPVIVAGRLEREVPWPAPAWAAARTAREAACQGVRPYRKAVVGILWGS